MPTVWKFRKPQCLSRPVQGLIYLLLCELGISKSQTGTNYDVALTLTSAIPRNTSEHLHALCSNKHSLFAIHNTDSWSALWLIPRHLSAWSRFCRKPGPPNDRASWSSKTKADTHRTMSQQMPTISSDNTIGNTGFVWNDTVLNSTANSGKALGHVWQHSAAAASEDA